jgi:hypothetical protein
MGLHRREYSAAQSPSGSRSRRIRKILGADQKSESRRKGKVKRHQTNESTERLLTSRRMSPAVGAPGANRNRSQAAGKTETLPRERPGSVSEQQNTKTSPAVEDPGESKNRTNESSGDRLGNSKNEISTLRQERSNHSAHEQVAQIW